MAKFGKWRNLTELMRSLSVGLDRLTFADNLPTEMRWNDWGPITLRDLFPTGYITNVRGMGCRYSVANSICFLRGRITFDNVSPSGLLILVLYLPVPSVDEHCSLNVQFMGNVGMGVYMCLCPAICAQDLHGKYRWLYIFHSPHIPSSGAPNTFPFLAGTGLSLFIEGAYQV